MPSGGVGGGGAMPSGGGGECAMPSGGEAGGAMLSSGGGGGAMPSGGGGECAMSSGGEAGGAMPFRTSGGGELGGGGGGGVLSPNEGALGGDGGVGVLTKNLHNTCQVSMCSRVDVKKWGWRWEDRESKKRKYAHRRTESAVAFAAHMACMNGMTACAWQRSRRTIRGETCRRMVLENLRVPREGVVVLRKDSSVRHLEEHWSQRKGSGGSKKQKRQESRHRTVTVTAQRPGDSKMLTTAVRREAHQPTDSRTVGWRTADTRSALASRETRA